MSLVLISLLSIFVSSPSQAAELPAGLKVVVQRTKDGEVATIRLLGLSSDYSARKPGEPAAYAKKTALLLAKILPQKYAPLPDLLETVVKGFHRLPDGQAPASQIAGEFEAKEKDGEFHVVLASKGADGTYGYNGDLWDQMDETNRAAALVHLALHEMPEKIEEKDIQSIVLNSFSSTEDKDIAINTLHFKTRYFYSLNSSVMTEYFKYDTIKEQDEASKKALEAFPKACEDWKVAVATKIKPVAENYYLDCGAAEARTIASHGAKYYVGNSNGSIFVTLSQGAVVVSEPVIGNLTASSVNGAVITAYKSYVDARKGWVSALDKKWGSDLLIADCAPFKQKNVRESARTGLSSISGHAVFGTCNALLDVKDKQTSYYSPTIDGNYWNSREVKAGNLTLYRSRLDNHYRDSAYETATKELRSVATDCATWKETMSRNLGGRLVFASCGNTEEGWNSIDAKAWVLE